MISVQVLAARSTPPAVTKASRVNPAAKARPTTDIRAHAQSERTG